mmetsp:Transcript_98609/g.190426  ORF Transcript_98609/g.190426 Transcript_98609/m.190426 type:complete len:83 (+) Transcript_98609:1335-1583(+)
MASANANLNRVGLVLATTLPQQSVVSRCRKRLAFALGPRLISKDSAATSEQAPVVTQLLAAMQQAMRYIAPIIQPFLGEIHA